MPTQPGKLSDAKFIPWKPKKIIHARLSLRPWEEGNKLDFYVGKPQQDPVGVDIETYAKKVATAQPLHIKTIPSPTQWDVYVDGQCYVLFELDPAIPNWQFRGHGIVSKGSNDAYDFEMRWVSPKGDIKDDPIQGDRCRVLYISVGQRNKDGHHNYNLLVDILDPGSKKRMPLIFDPDVPNGGLEFP
jgi:hypothetical protein